jgi:hypothetical protein
MARPYPALPHASFPVYNDVRRVTHLDVLLGVLEVFKESVVSPHDARLFVGTAVGVTFSLSGLATPKAVQVGSLSK